MNATLYQPNARLKRYIDNYMLVDINWQEVPPDLSIWRLIPFGQISMLFLFGDPHEYSLEGPDYTMLKTQDVFMVGQLTRPIWINFSGHTRLIKIQFKSAGIQRFLPFNLREFIDVPSVCLESIWGKAVSELQDKLYNAQTDLIRIEELEKFLEGKLLPASNLIDYIEFTVEHLKIGRGNLPINTVTARLGITQRHLERLFQARVGLTPKELSKIIRLNYAIEALKSCSSASLSKVSHAAGYYDQPHFSRDFKGLTGVAPSRLLSASASELFVTKGKCFIA